MSARKITLKANFHCETPNLIYVIFCDGCKEEKKNT